MFNTSQCKQTQVCLDKVVKRPEDPFPRVCESVTYGKSRNVVNGLFVGCLLLDGLTVPFLVRGTVLLAKFITKKTFNRMFFLNVFLHQQVLSYSEDMKLNGK